MLDLEQVRHSELPLIFEPGNLHHITIFCKEKVRHSEIIAPFFFPP